MQRHLISHANRCVQQYHIAKKRDKMKIEIEIKNKNQNQNEDGDKSKDDNKDENDAFHNLGLLYANQGKLAEAEKIYQRALNRYEKA